MGYSSMHRLIKLKCVSYLPRIIVIHKDMGKDYSICVDYRNYETDGIATRDIF